MTASDGSVVGRATVSDHGPAARRFNLIVVADGFRAADQAAFAAAVTSFANTLFATPPFDIYRTAVNVYRLDVSSTDAGADDPAGPPCNGSGATANTFFDSAFCFGGLPRLLGAPTGPVLSEATKALPEKHHTLLLVNTAQYGGSGGAVATYSMHASATQIGIHELGHSAFGLADEYPYWVGCGTAEPTHQSYAGAEPVEPNVTASTAWPSVKWHDQLTVADSTLPVLKNANCAVCDPQANPLGADTVGAYDGARYFRCGIFRPSFDCKMNHLASPFCAVCRRRIGNVLSDFAHRPEEVMRETWTLGWTHLVPFDLGGVCHMLSFKAASGGVSIDRLRADTSGWDNTMGSTWGGGWTSFVPMRSGAGQHLLLHNAVTGNTELDDVSADGADVTTRWTASWSTGWTHMTTFRRGADDFLLSYKILTGSVAIDRLRADGSAVDSTLGSTWSPGWTHLVPIEVGPAQRLLLYNAVTGSAQLCTISDDGVNVTTDVNMSWSPGWTSFVPFKRFGDTFWVAYKAATGLMAVDRVRPDRTGVDTLVMRSWQPGWGPFAPLHIGDEPYEVAYNPVTGVAAIDHIW